MIRERVEAARWAQCDRFADFKSTNVIISTDMRVRDVQLFRKETIQLV